MKSKEKQNIWHKGNKLSTTDAMKAGDIIEARQSEEAKVIAMNKAADEAAMENMAMEEMAQEEPMMNRGGLVPRYRNGGYVRYSDNKKSVGSNMSSGRTVTDVHADAYARGKKMGFKS